MPRPTKNNTTSSACTRATVLINMALFRSSGLLHCLPGQLWSTWQTPGRTDTPNKSFTSVTIHSRSQLLHLRGTKVFVIAATPGFALKCTVRRELQEMRSCQANLCLSVRWDFGCRVYFSQAPESSSRYCLTIWCKIELIHTG